MLLLACLLPACSYDSVSTASNGTVTVTSATATETTATETTEGTTDVPTTGPSTGATGATGGASTEPDPDTTTSGTSTGEATDSTSASTGEVSTGEVSASDTSTGSASDTSTGSGSDTSTGDPDGLGQAALDIAAALEAAVDGVLYLSESEDNWTVFAIADAAPVTEDNVKDVIAEVYVPHDDLPLADRVVELRTLAQLMDPLTVMQDWWGPDEMMQAENYKPIRAIFENQLSNVQVFRLGKQVGNVLSGQIDVFVIGETADGDIVGMFAIAVET